jgi:hypothetical protein
MCDSRMSAVLAEILTRQERVSKLLECLRRLPQLERLAWYVAVLPALAVLEPTSASQELLFAIAQDISETCKSGLHSPLVPASN